MLQAILALRHCDILNADIADRYLVISRTEHEVPEREVDGAVLIVRHGQSSCLRLRRLSVDSDDKGLFVSSFGPDNNIEVVRADLHINNLFQRALHVDVDSDKELLVVEFALQLHGNLAQHGAYPNVNIWQVTALDGDVALAFEVLQAILALRHCDVLNADIADRYRVISRTEHEVPERKVDGAVLIVCHGQSRCLRLRRLSVDCDDKGLLIDPFTLCHAAEGK